MEDYVKPLPHLNPETFPFWDGLKRNKLLIPKCMECGNFFFYPRSLCPHCLSGKIEWVRVTGRGKIYSFTISYRPATPAFEPELPYNVAIVDLEEGVRLMTNIIRCNHEELKIDLPVEIEFEEANTEITLPKFRPIL